MIRKVMPIPRISIISRNSQLSQERRKKKEQTDSDSKFQPIELTKPSENTRNA